jgi:hypothetical protein
MNLQNEPNIDFIRASSDFFIVPRTSHKAKGAASALISLPRPFKRL